MTISKEQIIKYFKSGIKEKKNFKIGIEHEKFLFSLIPELKCSIIFSLELIIS